MSFLLRRPPVLRSAIVSPARDFHASTRRAALSESDHHRHDDAERRQEIDKHKDESVSKAKNGEGEWKRELASSSEAAVKADRGEIEATEENIKKLQKETEEIAKQH